MQRALARCFYASQLSGYAFSNCICSYLHSTFMMISQSGVPQAVQHGSAYMEVLIPPC